MKRSIMSTTKSGTAADNNGKGSTYAGTQSPDPNAPDGYQTPQKGEEAENTDQTPPENLGEEYDNKASYGDKEQDPASAAGSKSPTDGDNAAGSPIR
jgi:hypothetical protein